MMFLTHVLWALVMLVMLGVKDLPVFLSGVAGAMMPDADAPNSVIGKLIKPLSAFINRRCGHRTVTHSMLALSLLGALSGLVYFFTRSPIPLALLFGYFSHLLLDMFNPSGIPLIYPNPTGFVMLGGPVTVGSMQEWIFRGILCAVLVSISFMLWKNINPVHLLKMALGSGMQAVVERYWDLDRDYIVAAQVEGYAFSSNRLVQFEGTVIDGYESTLLVYHDGCVYGLSDSDSSLFSARVSLVKKHMAKNKEVVMGEESFDGYAEFLDRIDDPDALLTGKVFFDEKFDPESEFLVEAVQKKRPENTALIRIENGHALAFRRAPAGLLDKIKYHVPKSAMRISPIVVATKVEI